MGVGPSSEYTFCVYCTPVGSYFKSTDKHDDEGNERAVPPPPHPDGPAHAQLEELAQVTLAPPISLCAIERFHRAAEGMTGGIKASGNYAPCFKASKEVKVSNIAPATGSGPHRPLTTCAHPHTPGSWVQRGSVSRLQVRRLC